MLTRPVALLCLLAAPVALGASPEAIAAARSGEDAAGTTAAVRYLGGMGALEAGDYETAATRFRDALDIDPELHGARAGYVRALMALEQDATALAAVADGLVRAPGHAVLLDLLGDLEDRRDRPAAALAAWEQAYATAPTPALAGKIARARRETERAALHGLAAGSGFQVVHDGEVDGILATQVVDFLQDELQRVGRLLSHLPSRPITVILYSDRQFRDVTGAPDWVGGLYDGKIRVPLGGLDTLDPAARRLLTHELTHALVHSKTRGGCPRWLHEGLAQKLEGRVLLRSELAALADAVRGVGAEGAHRLPASYPLCLSQVEHLESHWGFDSLVHLLDSLADGATVDAALRRVTGDDYAGFSRRWAMALLAGQAR